MDERKKKKISLKMKAKKYENLSGSFLTYGSFVGFVSTFASSIIMILLYFVYERKISLILLALIYAIPTILVIISAIYKWKNIRITNAVLDGKIPHDKYYGDDEK